MEQFSGLAQKTQKYNLSTTPPFFCAHEPNIRYIDQSDFLKRKYKKAQDMHTQCVCFGLFLFSTYLTIFFYFVKYFLALVIRRATLLPFRKEGRDLPGLLNGSNL